MARKLFFGALVVGLSLGLAVACGGDDEDGGGGTGGAGGEGTGGAGSGGSASGGTDGGGGAGGACSADEGEECNPDTCACTGSLECLPEDGPGTTSTHRCFDDSVTGTAADGADCAYGFECSSTYCYPDTAGGDNVCQSSCLAAGADALGTQSCCSGAIVGGKCN